jgi:hypothetical protein
MLASRSIAINSVRTPLPINCLWMLGEHLNGTSLGKHIFDLLLRRGHSLCHLLFICHEDILDGLNGGFLNIVI